MDLNRYNRQILLTDFGAESQKKMFGTKVLVIGVGGLGCPALQVLVSAGIGHIGLVDFDVVDFHNLHRQFLFDESSVGLPKVVVAQKKLKQLNSEVEINVFNETIDVKNAFSIIKDYDIVMDCTDNFSTRYLVNDACYILNKPLVYGALYRYEGQVALFNVLSEGMITNYRDLFPKAPHPDEVPNCNIAGVLPTLSAIIGTFQANEVIKYIIGSKECLIHKLLIFNIRNYQQMILSYRENENKEFPKDEPEFERFDYLTFCGINSTENVYSEQELKDFLSKENSVLIDVRESDEYPKLNYDRVIEIPLSILEDQLHQLEKFDKICFVCVSGTRSLKALEIAKKQFPSKELKNLEKGIKTIGL